MLVDDDEDNLNAAHRRLAAEYEVVLCRSGEEAVRQFVARTAPVSAVVMDIRMPGMSGTRAAKLIRNNDPFVPIIFRTGFSDEYPEDEVLSQYDGTVDYVTKGQRGHDFYLERAIRRGIKSYEAVAQLNESHERLKDYEVRLQMLVEQLIAHERALQTAVDFQTSLLGRPRDRFGILFAAAHRFCDQMGGDFYDVVEVSDQKTGVLIADVCGHGIPAALLTGMLKAQLEATVHLEDPVKVIRGIDERFRDMLSRQSKLITAAYAIADHTTGRVTYASAGHHPLMLVRADGNVEKHESTGFPVGASNETGAEAREFALNSGDSLWLYTDGLCELQNPVGEILGEARLTEALRTLRRPELQQWVEGVFAHCDRFRMDRPISDDMTLLAAMRM
jgi:serine phosphatase RsbU (regulator of sigma subunit)